MPRTTTNPPPPKKSWDERAQELIDFRRAHGDFVLPAAKEFMPLRCWMRRLRQWHEAETQGLPNKRPACSLTKKRVKELDALGFSWKVKSHPYQRWEESVSDEVRWKRRVQDFKDFQREHGHCNVPCRFPENPSFGYWMVTVRKEFRKAKKGEEQTLLTPGRIVQLETLGFPWAVVGGLLGSQDYTEEQVELHKRENEAFINELHRRLREEDQMEELSHPDEIDEPSAAKVDVPPRKRTKKRKVQSGNKGALPAPTKAKFILKATKKKRKVQCDNTSDNTSDIDVQQTSNKKQRRGCQERGVEGSEQRNTSIEELLENRPKSRHAFESDFHDTSWSSSSSSVSTYKLQPDTFTGESANNKVDSFSHSNISDEKASPKPKKTLGERLRASFERRLIVVSL